MSPTENYYFLGKCLSLGENWVDPDSIIQSIDKWNIDWRKFVSLASANFVLSTVYCRFRQFGILPFLPDDLKDHLLEIYELNKQRNLEVLNQIGRINMLLATKHIVPIYLKSTGNILDHLYQDIGERMFGDIDLLVSDNEFLPSVNLLKEAGYSMGSGFYDDQLITKHYPRLIHPSENLAVEVHRLPVDFGLSSSFNYEIVNAEKKMAETTPPCFVLSDRHKLTMNFFHGFMASDIRTSHWVALRDMVDFILLEKWVNITEVVKTQPKFSSQIEMYSNLVHHTMGKPIKTEIGFGSRCFIRRTEWFLKSKTFYRFFWLVTFLFNRLFLGYFATFFKLFFSQQVRKSVYRRLSNRRWYKAHLVSYIKYFHRYLHNSERKGKN
jgi:hypothetical protein